MSAKRGPVFYWRPSEVSNSSLDSDDILHDNCFFKSRRRIIIRVMAFYLHRNEDFSEIPYHFREGADCFRVQTCIPSVPMFQGPVNPTPRRLALRRPGSTDQQIRA
jgi:hypothetical protein